MRHRIATLALFAALAAAACSDSPTTSSVRPFDGVMNLTLDDFIQTSIDNYLPRGFEAAVEARWSSIRNKKNAGDFAGAVKQLNTLSLWIDRKTADITIPAGETVTRNQAAAIIVLNMARWVYEGADADPEIVPTGDATIEFSPAFTALDMSTPSQHAGIEWDATASDVDRVVVLLEDPSQYPGHCSGPLVTRRCQYPLFYKAESFPHTALVHPGRFAVCMVTTGPRRPLEYLEDEPHGEVDGRMRVAHNLPASAADYTPGATQEDDIEILPVSFTQSGTVVNCTAPSSASMNPVERALYAVSNFAARFISPKNAYAFDQGPEHDFSFFSNFNAVDPLSQPDVSVTNVAGTTEGFVGASASVTYSLQNISRRAGGLATARSPGGTVRVYLSTDAVLGGDVSLGSEVFGAMLPDAPAVTGVQNFSLPASAGTYFILINFEPNAGGLTEVSSENNLTVHQVVVRDPTGNVTGFVRDAFTNAAVSGATVTSGTSTATTNSDGFFELVGLLAGVHSITSSAPNYTSATRNGVTVTAGATTTIDPLLLIPPAASTDLRIVLTWGASPNDLDSHLTGPSASESRFHVYYAARIFSDAVSAATLDRDDTFQFGPETITLTLQSAGTYAYYVHNFTSRAGGEPFLTTSGATVEVYSGSSTTPLHTFSVPTTGTGTYWHVFNLSGTTFTTVNTLTTVQPGLMAGLTASGSTAKSTAVFNDLPRVASDIRNTPKEP